MSLFAHESCGNSAQTETLVLQLRDPSQLAVSGPPVPCRAAMIELIINGVSQSFPRVWTVLLALARLGHDPRHFGLRRQDGTWVGSTGTLGELLSDGDELELTRL